MKDVDHVLRKPFSEKGVHELKILGARRENTQRSKEFLEKQKSKKKRIRAGIECAES